MTTLLAVDVGVRCGLALYGDDGRLRWYRSHNFGSAARLRRAIPSILSELDEPAWLILEGGGTLAEYWKHEARRRGIRVRIVAAEDWRRRLLLPRDQRSGRDAKRHADGAAKRVIAWSGAKRPKALRHDAAEAILVGLWGVLAIGWLDELPLSIGPSVSGLALPY